MGSAVKRPGQDFKDRDVSGDLDFQKRFKGFYRIRRGKQFSLKYFTFLEVNKRNQNLTFLAVVEELLPLGKLEASFSSKMLATINPDLPIWDSIVLKNIAHEFADTRKNGNRLEIANHKYDSIIKWYKSKLSSDQGREMINTFNAKHLDMPLTDTKKIDLVLWQMR